MADGADDAPPPPPPAVPAGEAMAPAVLVAHFREVVPLLLGGSEGELAQALSSQTALLGRSVGVFFFFVVCFFHCLRCWPRGLTSPARTLPQVHRGAATPRADDQAHRRQQGRR